MRMRRAPNWHQSSGRPCAGAAWAQAAHPDGRARHALGAAPLAAPAGHPPARGQAPCEDAEQHAGGGLCGASGREMPPACRANRMRPDEEEPACGCRAQKAVRIQAPCTPQARSPLRCAAAPVLGFLVIGGWRAAPGGFAPMRIACPARSGPPARPLRPVACRTRNQPQILRAGGGRTGACRAGQRGSSARHAAIPRRQGITARRRSSLWTAALCASAMAALGLSVSIPAAWAGRGRGGDHPEPAVRAARLWNMRSPRSIAE